MNEKLTKNEQAEKQSNAFIESCLSHVSKPPQGLGQANCIDCDDTIPMARRKAYGNGLCVECAEFNERIL